MTRLFRKTATLLPVLLLLSHFPNVSFAQKAKTHVLTMDEAKMVKRDAGTMFAAGDYNGALKAYKDLVKSDAKNVDYNYKLGYCYLQTNTDKKASLSYLEFATKAKEAKKEWMFYLGQAYMFNEKWDDAIAAFNDFKDSKQKPIKDQPAVERMIEYCNNAKELTAKPINCTYTNLGKVINTVYEEYNPFISADGKLLVFTSRRKGNVGGFIEDLGIYTADIYTSIWKDTVWAKPKGLGGMVNTEWDEESVGLTPDGDLILIYFDNGESYADIGGTSLKGKMWQKPMMMPEQVNSKNYEGGATMSLDGRTVIFSSTKKEGYGETDLYMVHKEKNGEWTAPVNLGTNINTKYAEESPCLSIDGKTLFFASKGWNSMGGFDIFYSTYDDASNSWSKPVNFGYPINDADDNQFISFTGDMRSAYVAAIRPEGLGDQDIYKVDFPDESHHPYKSFMTGSLTSTGGKIELTKASLENKTNGSSIEYIPSISNNSFIFPASPGTYNLHIEGYNFEPYNEEVILEAGPAKEIVHNVQVKSAK